MPLSGRVRLGGLALLASPEPLDAGQAHEPVHLVTSDVVAGASRCLPELAHPIDPEVRLPDRDQQRHQHGIAPARAEIGRDFAA